MSCKECIYWKQSMYVKSFGDCLAPVPFWVFRNDDIDDVTHYAEGINCTMFHEDESDERTE